MRGIARFAAAGSVLAFLTVASPGCGSDSEPAPREHTGCLDLCPVYPGAATLTADRAQVPADGASLTTARATFTDPRGLGLVDSPVVLFADVPDITWVAVDPDDPQNPAPTRCLTSTSVDGSAECMFRAGHTIGRTLLHARQLVEPSLEAATEVELVP